MGLNLCFNLLKYWLRSSAVCVFSHLQADVVLWGPGSIFSAMCFLSAILFSKLPETRGQPMPNTIADMKQRVAARRDNNNTNVLNYQVGIVKPKEININN